MTAEGTEATPPLRRITVEDADRALDFLVAVTVHLTDETRPSLETLMHIARNHRDLFLAPEEYRPNQEIDLLVEELRHAIRVLLAVSEGDFLIPDHESPWEDWDGERPVSARTPVVVPTSEACGGVSAEPPHGPPPEATTGHTLEHAADS